jgi:hypothetical protein
MHLYKMTCIVLVMSIILTLAGSTHGSTNVVDVTFTTGKATSSSMGTVTIDLSYTYNLSRTMVGGQPAWFRSCTWGELPVIAGGNGTGSPPIEYIGGDPELQQNIRVQYWSDLPVDFYFLTHDQELSWLYYTSLWPYQFCAPPFYGWTYGSENATYASFTATLPAATCPCSILMFNMKTSEAHVRFVVNGLGVSIEVPRANRATLSNTFTTKEAPFVQADSGVLATVCLVLVVVVAVGIWMRARSTERRHGSWPSR